MKKILSLIILALASLQAGLAQSIVTGTVVDSKGNPIHGALVSDKKELYNTTTGFDGGFTLESPSDIKKLTAMFVGYCPETKKSENGMTIVLKKENWWNTKQKSGFFFGPQMFVGSRVVPGIELGYLGIVGGYLKGFYSFNSKSENYIRDPWFDNNGKADDCYVGVIAGMSVRLNSPLHFYVGCGYLHRDIYWQMINGQWKIMDCGVVGNSVVLDCGLKLQLKRIVINAGVIYSFGDPKLYDDEYYSSVRDYDYKNRVKFSCGVSYIF